MSDAHDSQSSGLPLQRLLLGTQTLQVFSSEALLLVDVLPLSASAEARSRLCA